MEATSPTTLAPTLDTEALRQRWAQLTAQETHLRLYDAARQLGVPELAVRESELGEGTTRLEGDWEELFFRIPAFGRVKALTRNHAVVHETQGVFGGIEFYEHGMGVVHDGTMDLRQFVGRWKHVMAV